MKLIIETRKGAVEGRWDSKEIRHETEIGWDAGADDYVAALAAFLFARTFSPETIADAFRDYAEEWDLGHETAGDGEWDEYEEAGAAEADEKTAPDEGA